MLVSRTGIEPIPTRYLVPFLVLESALTARRGFTDGELLYISASVGRTWWAHCAFTRINRTPAFVRKSSRICARWTRSCYLCRDSVPDNLNKPLGGRVFC